ncbi:MAG: efflux RND transporter periplasmic adaptor subunit [Halioglobus sp.]|nr:efflux RND transporter periplasmic adaptor subunit [Halioglobus sp.]
MPKTPVATTRPAPRRLSGLWGFAAAALLIAGLTLALHARKALTERTPSRPLLTVASTTYVLQDSYLRQVSYLGLIAAGRRATLGFEIPGQIARMPLRQGDAVRAGALIAALDDSALRVRRAAAAADLEQVRAELELARLKARRQGELSASGAVSEEAFDETRLRARALASRLEAVTARLAGIDITLRQSELRAPYAGVIADRYVYEGAVVSPGTPVLKLIETTAQEAHIGVAAERAAAFARGERYVLELRDTAFEAAVLSVRPDVDPVTRTATVVFDIPAGVDALDGEPVTLQLTERVEESGGWLPIAALLEGQRGVWTVLRLEPHEGALRAVREVVEVLDLRGDRAYVRGTLTDAAAVVASGVHRITPGSLVTARAGG